MRGLKPWLVGSQSDQWVAPHTGAWIETLINHSPFLNLASHPTRVRGLKLEFDEFARIVERRTPHGCVD